MTKHEKIYSVVALVFHVTGAIGMATEAREWFLACTPYTLLLMTALLLLSVRQWYKNLYFFFIFSAIAGFGAEWTGVNTGLLFGEYTYGDRFGIKAGNVPLLIAALWASTVYAGIQAVRWWEQTTGKQSNSLTASIAGALLITLYDIMLEPTAIELGYWSWSGGVVPVYNYISWFLVSGTIIFLSEKFFKIQKDSLFPLILCLIQVGFYMWHLFV